MADQEKNEQTQMSLGDKPEEEKKDEQSVADPVVKETLGEVSTVQEQVTEPSKQEEVQKVEVPVDEGTGKATQEVQTEVKAEVEPVEPAGQPVQEVKPTETAVEKGPLPAMLKTATNQPKVTNEEKIWALVSYIPLLAVMSLVLKPNSDYIKLHGRQGLLIFLIFFFSIFVYLVPYIGPVIGIFVHVACIAIGVLSMYHAFIGNWWKIPVLGDIAELIPVEMFVKVTRSAVMGPTEEKIQEQQEVKEKEASPVTETTQGEVQPPAETTNVPAEEVKSTESTNTQQEAEASDSNPSGKP